AEVADVVELLRKPAEIPYAVVVRIEERLDVELVDDCVFVPLRIVGNDGVLGIGGNSGYGEIHEAPAIRSNRSRARRARAGARRTRAPCRARARRSCDGPARDNARPSTDRAPGTAAPVPGPESQDRARPSRSGGGAHRDSPPRAACCH